MPAEVLKISRDQPEPAALEYAASLLRRGAVVAIPTDTLYGLAADPFNLAAVERVFRIKGRAETKALPILIDAMERVPILVREVPEAFYRLAKAFWPGALTLVVYASYRIPFKVTGNTGRIALRWPKCPAVCELIGLMDGPITGTSANLSGFPSCSNAAQIIKQLGDRVALILDGGESGKTLPSTIVDIRTDDWRIVREGAIPEADILQAMS